MKKIRLNGQWTLSGDGIEKEIVVNVPGCVHTDLINNGIIKDIFYRDNADSVQWIENHNWTYEKSFQIDDIEKGAYLVFEGLDVYCDVYLNGTHLGYCDNMFIPHSFSVENILKKGENNIKVCFYSPIEKTKDAPKLSGAFTTERLHTRRIQCTYGWDWVQRFVTCGIIKDTYIMFDNTQRCDSVYVYTKSIDSFSAQICVEAYFKNVTGKNVVFEIDHGGKTLLTKEFYVDQDFVKFYVDIKNPVLWKLGCDNELYNLTCTVENEILKQPFGIRTAKILQLPDEVGSPSYNKCIRLQETESGKEYDQNKEFSSFELVLNGSRIMCKGANWVPCEPFTSDESDEKITRILALSRDAGINMIRVWGGGVFEKDHFYNECDRLGISVTQDFLMACGKYPENEDWFINQLAKEAECVAKRLRNHPCLMWWSGDNENAIRGCDTDENYQGRRSAVEGIAPALKKYDHTRYFLPSSPYGGTPYASKTFGTTHNTQFCGYLFGYMTEDDLSDYKDRLKEYDARFIAEEPCYGSADEEALKNFMTEDDIYNSMDMWYYHSKTNPGLKKELMDYCLSFAEGVLGKFKDGKDRFFKLRYIMYEWMRVSLERARRNRGFCNGIIYWMLNDCWPSAGSWSIIDYYNNPKAGYYSFKRCAENTVLSFDRENGDFFIYLCNDTDDAIEKTVSLKLIDIKTGDTIKTKEVQMKTVGQSASSMQINDMSPDDSSAIFAYCEEKYAFYKNGCLYIEKCKPVHIVEQTDNKITLKADEYTHVVALEGGIFEDNYFFMQKNEERTINIIQKSDEVDVMCYTFLR